MVGLRWHLPRYSKRIESGKRKDQKKKEIISRGTSLFEGETLKTSLGCVYFNGTEGLGRPVRFQNMI
jgi:hypothetical protein